MLERKITVVSDKRVSIPPEEEMAAEEQKVERKFDDVTAALVGSNMALAFQPPELQLDTVTRFGAPNYDVQATKKLEVLKKAAPHAALDSIANIITRHRDSIEQEGSDDAIEGVAVLNAFVTQVGLLLAMQKGGPES